MVRKALDVAFEGTLPWRTLTPIVESRLYIVLHYLYLSSCSLCVTVGSCALL